MATDYTEAVNSPAHAHETLTEQAHLIVTSATPNEPSANSHADNVHRQNGSIKKMGESA